MKLVEEFQRIISLFESEGIEYAVCGGFAVTLLGAPRLTHDMDFLILEEAAHQVKALLKEHGYTLGVRIPFGVGTDGFRQVDRVTKVGDDVFTVDLLLVRDVDEVAWNSRFRMEGGGQVLWVVGKEGIAEMKRQAGRPKDLEDLRNLGIE